MAEYSSITELPGHQAPQEQFQRLYQRYYLASKYCMGKSVLEVACGSGMGLGFLAKFAERVVGCDIDEDNLKFASQTYKGRKNVGILKLDAHKLPLENNSFDVALLYEAIYYLPYPEKFVEEVNRVLKKEGVLIICTVNKDWSDFNPSPHSVHYFSAPELFSLLKSKFAHVELYGGFEAYAKTPKDKIISLIKRAVVALHLMPKTMKGKEKFKRLFFGKLSPLPREIMDGMSEYLSPAPIPSDSPNSQYKVLYAVARAF